MRHIDYGLGVFRADSFRKMKARDLADVYQELLQAGELAAVEISGRFYEMGSPTGLEEMKSLLSRPGDAQK
jgi:NDP-sugar pyrophosphorylase family protein